jgi:RHS repeat-associated protein
MLPIAEERIPALTNGEEIFSLAAGVALAALDTDQGARTAQGKKPHQRIFSRNRRIASGATWAKWPGTHQVSGQWWSETVLGIVIDANGNTLSDPSGKSYSWDFENRLVSAVVPGSGTVTFKYDPFGRRIQKASWLGTTNYLYEGRNLLEELDASGNALARYTQSPGLDQPLAELRSTVTSYYEQDGLGSVSALSNSAGALANTYTYDSFGKLAASTGTLANPFQFTGREFDPETGIYQYRHRYYDPNGGRFISEDPIGFGGGANFYRYVFNSPTNLVDPWGLAPNCVMTHSGLVCTGANPVSDQVDVLQLFFPGSQRDGNNSMNIPMSCDDVNKILGNSGYYTGGPFSSGNWMTQNPFLFWDPIYHWGGSEWRNLYGFHFRRKYTLCDKSCTLDEFHIDSSNPMFDPGTHFLHDFMGLK